MSPLKREELDEIEAAIAGFEPLYPDVPVEHRFTGKVKGRFGVQAPHYLIMGGQGVAGEMENIGFIYEQLALWMDAKELGCVWLGSSKAADGSKPGDVLAMAFGRCTEPVHREPGEMKRKPIGDVTNAPDDPCIQAVHMAPSGMNTQPWYIEKQGDEALVYRQKLKAPISMLYKLSDVDMGIGLCHYMLACREAGKAFGFDRQAKLPDKGGYAGFGIIR